MCGHVWKVARVTDPGDMDQIKVALQGYNYGTGYITWVWNNYAGEYTPENAQLFSENQKAALGWSVYGDPQYVEHVLRYYNPGETTIEFVTDGAQFAWPVRDTRILPVTLALVGVPHIRASISPMETFPAYQLWRPVPVQ